MSQTEDLDIPPFPSDVPLAPIARISSAALLSKDDSTGTAVLKATQTAGFFYLDMTDSPSGQELLSEAEQLQRLSQTAFTMPLEEKLKYRLINGISMFGYKAAGAVKQTDKSARPDATEFFNVGKDHLHDVTPSRDYPSDLEAARPLLASFAAHAHTMGMVVLRTLARHLELPEETFADLNLFRKPAGDHVRLTHTPATLPSQESFPLPSHTDFGSVTLLFNWLGGLQIESRDPARHGSWDYVKPLPGHAIINLGDAMVKFTNGALKSAKHRVVTAPGEQRQCERYSIVYFVRPHDEALMKPVERFEKGENVKVGGKVSVGDGDGKIYTAGEWMSRRAMQMMGNLK
jgi:isopenicillin N synthase-like dioxygenase